MVRLRLHADRSRYRNGSLLGVDEHVADGFAVWPDVANASAHYPYVLALRLRRQQVREHRFSSSSKRCGQVDGPLPGGIARGPTARRPDPEKDGASLRGQDYLHFARLLVSPASAREGNANTHNPNVVANRFFIVTSRIKNAPS